MPRLVPALCCAALAIACVSAFAPRLSGTAVDAAATPMPVSIDSIAAGGEQAAPMTRMADVSGTARVRAAGGGSESLFASASGDIPLVAVNETDGASPVPAGDPLDSVAGELPQRGGAPALNVGGLVASLRRRHAPDERYRAYARRKKQGPRRAHLAYKFALR